MTTPTCKCVAQGYPEEDCQWHGKVTPIVLHPFQEDAQYAKHVDEVYEHAKRHPAVWPAGMGSVVDSLMFERAVA
jgi:hypothetical protein